MWTNVNGTWIVYMNVASFFNCQVLFLIVIISKYPKWWWYDPIAPSDCSSGELQRSNENMKLLQIQQWVWNLLKRLPEHEADCIDDLDDQSWRGTVRPQLVESRLVQASQGMQGCFIDWVHLEANTTQTRFHITSLYTPIQKWMLQLHSIFIAGFCFNNRIKNDNYWSKNNFLIW